jgi:hypothetical protein
MSAPALNLLRYPRRTVWVNKPVVLQLLFGILAGVLCVSAWGLWGQSRYSHGLQLREQLQASARVQAQARTEALAFAEYARLQQQARQRVEDWRVRREQLQRLHALLSQENREIGLRLQRWQGDGQRIQLQAWLPRAEDLPGLQARLSVIGPQTWVLHSLGHATGAGLQLVLESSWPKAGPPSGLPVQPASSRGRGQP